MRSIVSGKKVLKVSEKPAMPVEERPECG